MKEILKEIYKLEGIKGYFRGNLADISRSIPYSGLIKKI
jgi:hypothetical protein